MTYDNSKKDCPRGFHWCKDQKKCVPEVDGVDAKLEVKYQRYFFKGEGPMETKRVIEAEKCQPGYRWCDKTNKCVPEDDAKQQGRGQGRGQGQGPMGRPFKEAEELVDLALDEFETFGKIVKARKQVDRILDAVNKDDKIDFGKGSPVTGRPYDHPKKIRATADIDECGMMGGGPMNKGIANAETEEEYEDDYVDAEAPPSDGPNDISHVPNQDGKALYASVRKQMLEMQYLDEAGKSKLLGFFTKMLKKWKAEPEMDQDEKIALNKTVGKQWKSKKVSEFYDLSENDKAAYKAYFQKMLKKFGAKSPADLDAEKKKAFFNAVDKGWKADHE